MRDDTLELTEDGLPATFTVGERTYRIHSFLEGDERHVSEHVMRERGVKMGAAMGKEDGEHIYKHSDEIPKEYRGKIYLAFPDWCDPRGNATYLRWYVDQWIQDWNWFGYSHQPAVDHLVSLEK